MQVAAKAAEVRHDLVVVVERLQPLHGLGRVGLVVEQRQL